MKKLIPALVLLAALQFSGPRSFAGQADTIEVYSPSMKKALNVS
jgi:hypothetical protein